jgi:uncharacterized protein YndB with AHSA1/START domain/DNA-binding transcriptional ArsR family regulator
LAEVDAMAPAFRALGDPSRRLLLDRLFERDGQTLGELAAHLPEMTRFGVMKHLDVLEDAGLITTRRFGREKRHYLNPVPIRLVHDRWISKYAEPIVGAMTVLKRNLEAESMSAAPDHVYAIYVKAAPERVWQALVTGDQTVGYYYGTRVASDWRVGSPIVYTYPDGSVAADGEVLAIDPPRTVEMRFHARWEPSVEQEGPVTQIWTVEPSDGGVTKLTLTTKGMALDSETWRQFTGGIPLILSGLKSLIETGRPLAA